MGVPAVNLVLQEYNDPGGSIFFSTDLITA